MWSHKTWRYNGLENMEVQWTGKIWRYSGLVKYGGTVGPGKTLRY